MNVFSWNCRGLGNQRTIQFLKEMVSQKKPSFIFLSETKCNKRRVDLVGRILGFKGGFCCRSPRYEWGLGLTLAK